MIRHDPKRILSLAATHFALLAGWVGSASGGLGIRYKKIRSDMTLNDVSGDSRDLIRTMVEVGLLEETPGEEDCWDVPHVIASFIKHLTKQQNLLLDGALRGIVEDIELQVGDLDKSLQGYGRRPSEVVEELIRHISHARRLSEEHAAAVLNIATGLKVEDGSRPARERYEAIRYLFERHINPMRSVIDVNGSLERILDRIIAISHLEAGVAQYSQAAFQRLRNYTIQLKREAARHFQESLDEVFPLYEKSRREHALSVMVTKALDMYRKHGEEAWDLKTHLVISRFSSDSLFSSQNVETFLARIDEVKSQPVRRNLVIKAKGKPPPLMPDIPDLRAAVEKLPVGTDILEWLFAIAPDCNESEVLGSYFNLNKIDDLRAYFDNTVVTRHYHRHKYTYYPRRIS